MAYEATWIDTHDPSDMSFLGQMTEIYQMTDMGLKADIVVIITSVPEWHGSVTMSAFSLSPALV